MKIVQATSVQDYPVAFRPLDFQKFDTFEEADQVAQDMAAGKYGYKTGKYINMR